MQKRMNIKFPKELEHKRQVAKAFDNRTLITTTVFSRKYITGENKEIEKKCDNGGT